MSTSDKMTTNMAPSEDIAKSAGHSSATSETQDVEVQEQDEKALQQQQTPNVPPQAMSPAPNGGRIAWIQVLCGFLLFVNTFGLLTTFGVFQTFYESSQSPFQNSSSNISWIGSIQAFLLQFGGLIAGPIFDKGHLRLLLCVGSFAIVFGLMMLSIASTYWEILLAQGFCVGLGMGCLYVPSISILPSYFSTRLGLAIGLASAGSAVGGVIYPIIIQQLTQSIGFPWAVRVVGFVALATLLVPIGLMRIRIKPARARAFIDWTAFTDVPFMWFAIATSICFMGLNAFQIYFSYYAAQQQITDATFALNLVSIYNAMSALGRIIPNAISDKTGQFNILAPAVLLTGVVYFCTIAVHSRGPMIGITILSGFFLGILTALPPVCFAILTKDKTKLGSRIGTGFAIIAFGILVSGPAAGGILQSGGSLQWPGLWSFAGASVLVAGSMYTVLRVAKFGWKPLVKA